MNADRRSFLKWVGSAPVGGTFVRIPGTDIVPPEREQTNASQSDPAEPELKVTQRSLSWVQKRLRNHYGNRFYRRPTKGIFHHYPDKTYDLLEKSAFVELAQAYHPQLVPGHEERFDCDEYAMGLRWLFLTGGFGKFPATNMVGQAHNFAGNHVYNVVMCADGSLLEWEPQTNTLASESGGPSEYYEFKNGILYL